MNAKINDNTIVIVDNNGVKREYSVLITIDNDENSKKYIVYSDMERTENNEVMIHANVYEPEKDEFKLFPIETEKEWKMINNIVKSATSAVKEEI